MASTFIASFAAVTVVANAQQLVSFSTSDGGRVFADTYGTGARGVVLAHGGRFDKESWKPQALTLAAAGFRVVAIDFRGYGRSRGPGDRNPLDAPLERDVLAATAYLRRAGATQVSVVGASMGATAAGDAVIGSPAGTIRRAVLMSETPNGPPERLHAKTLFIVARADRDSAGPRLRRIRVVYARAPQPKSLLILDGSAHGQFIFRSAEGTRVMRAIVAFLRAP